MDLKIKHYYMLLQETHLSCKDKHRLRVKGWKTILQANGFYRNTGIVLISHKTDFKREYVTRHKYGHIIMIKRKIHQDDITIINTYAASLKTPKYIKQLLTC